MGKVKEQEANTDNVNVDAETDAVEAVDGEIVGDTGLVKANTDSRVSLDAFNSNEMAIPAELLMELTAEIQSDLKSLRINKLTSASKMLGKSVSVKDAFLMTFDSWVTDKDDGQRCVFEVVDEATNEVHFVVQNPSGSRLTVVNIYNNVRKTQRQLTLTDCEFKEVGNGKFGNKAIILLPTEATKYHWN